MKTASPGEDSRRSCDANFHIFGYFERLILTRSTVLFLLELVDISLARILTSSSIVSSRVNQSSRHNHVRNFAFLCTSSNFCQSSEAAERRKCPFEHWKSSPSSLYPSSFLSSSGMLIFWRILQLWFDLGSYMLYLLRRCTLEYDAFSGTMCCTFHHY